MESSEQKGGFGTTVLVLLLALAFVVGTGLFAFIGYQFLNGGRGGPEQANQGTAVPPTETPQPTATSVPTSTPVPTVQPPATPLPAPTVTPAGTTRPGGEDSLPQTGVGPLASVASILLAGAALGSRWLRRRP